MAFGSPRAELLAIQKKLWLWNKKNIDRSIFVKEAGFDNYERVYEKAVGDFASIATQDELLGAVLDHDIIYVGDYHTCNQSQRSFLRILKACIKKDKKFSVGLELLHKRHQGILDKFLKGKLTEKVFLQKIKLKEHWVFDLWGNFKPLFDFCRYHHIPMYAIDAAKEGANVGQRDKATAKLIVDIMEMRQEAGGRRQEKQKTKYERRATRDERLFVFIGDLHVAPKHLPKDVDDELKKRGIKKSKLILFENSEPIYWKLAKDGIDDYVEVVRMKDGNFCRMHTPPVVCQRSYLNWLEHEEGEIDYADAKMSFLELVDRICEFLKLDIGKSKDDVEIFTCGDLSFLKRLEERGDFSKKEIKIIKKQILASESYYIAKAKFVYLANLSINHAAEEASHFIKSVCSGVERPRPLVDAFYANILHEALGFFGSKLINHKRKCHHEKDFKNLVRFFRKIKVPTERRLEMETANLVLEYLRSEQKGEHLLHEDILYSRTDLFLSITHALGYILGEMLYYGLLERKITKRDVKNLFTDPWRKIGRPFEVYSTLKEHLKKVKIPKRM